MRAAAACLLVAATAFAGSDGPQLVNASFEAPGDLPDGWSLAVGATSAGDGESVVAVDRDVASQGKSSLRLSGDANTGKWRTAAQIVDVKPGDRVTFRVAARCRGVVCDAGQFRNANALLVFSDAADRRLQIAASPQLAGDHGWADVVVDTIAPPGTTKAAVGLFLSMTGTVWFDDARLDVAPATADDAAGRGRTFDALADHLRRTYPFFGLAGKPAADPLFGRHRAKCVAAKDAVSFLDEIHLMLAELNDVHVNVETAKRRLATAQPNPSPPNWNMAAIRAALGNSLLELGAQGEGGIQSGRIGAGLPRKEQIGYVMLSTFQVNAGYESAIDKALDDLADTKALILDVRPNGGGDEKLAAQIAGRFTKEPVVYARAAWRDQLAPGTDAFEPPIDRVLKPVAPFDGRRVVVLQGPNCVSSTEGFLLMMRALPNGTTIGQTSRGASGNPAPFDLLPGVKVWTSRWRSLTPDGECIEGRGIAPRIVVEGSHAKSDPTLERAIAELRR